MTRCLRDKTLLMLVEGKGTDNERSHLESCEACGERYRQMRRDLDLIKQALEQDPSPSRLRPPQMPLLYRCIPAAAALAVGVILGWGGNWALRTNYSALSEQAFNSSLSQFLEEVSDAVFASTDVGEANAAASNPDFAFLQGALEGSCFDGCEEIESAQRMRRGLSRPRSQRSKGRQIRTFGE